MAYLRGSVPCFIPILVQHDDRASQICIVLATGPGNQPAVGVWTGQTVLFASRNAQKRDLLVVGGPNPAPYPSTIAFCWVWLDTSGPTTGFPFRVVPFLVAFRYQDVNREILAMVR